MSTVWETLDLVVRWIHVIAAIMWVGNSLLFNWLDRSLAKSGSPGQTSKPTGTIWLLHSGGFYYVEKTLLQGEKLPPRVHWFMWQAYTTWITGALLLIIVYYAGGRAVLADPTVANIPHWQAVLVGIGGIVVGRVIYETMQKVSLAPQVATTIWVVALTAIAIALTQLLNGRAAFLHVGAMLATIMAGNVGDTIVPSQKALVRSVTEGGESSQQLSDKAKRVSIHNNYFTFPVIVLMLISHFPAIYGHEWNWLLLLILVAGGAAVRHALNIRWTSASWKPALAGSIAFTVIPVWALLNVTPQSVQRTVDPVTSASFEDVRHIVDRRCGTCHSDRPTDTSLGRTPAGIKFDTPQEILMHASRIHARAVATKTMPPANKTNITDEERTLIGRWVAAGATVD